MSRLSTVAVRFKLANIDHERFIEWLQVECGVAEDGDGKFNIGKDKMVCTMERPVVVEIYDWEGK